VVAAQTGSVYPAPQIRAAVPYWVPRPPVRVSACPWNVFCRGKQAAELGK